MSAIFLSASVPVVGRGEFHDTANPFLIQCAVRELFLSVVREHVVVWGGHPSITPMVWSICEDLGMDYARQVVLYQSKFFEDRFPEENKRFGNVVYTEAVPNDLNASLDKMRETMISRTDLIAAVFIGGMEGVLVEHELFRKHHPQALVLPVASPGGAARQLAQDLNAYTDEDLVTVDYASLFFRHLGGLGRREMATV